MNPDAATGIIDAIVTRGDVGHLSLLLFVVALFSLVLLQRRDGIRQRNECREDTRIAWDAVDRISTALTGVRTVLEALKEARRR